MLPGIHFDINLQKIFMTMTPVWDGALRCIRLYSIVDIGLITLTSSCLSTQFMNGPICLLLCVSGIERWSKESARKIEPSKVKNFTFSLMQIRRPFHKLSEHVQTFNLVDEALDDCEIIVRRQDPQNNECIRSM